MLDRIWLRWFCVVALSLGLCRGTQVVWFCPLDPLLRPEVGYSGSPEYLSLFSPDAPWQKAAARVQIFKIYPQWITRAADSDLQRMFADLARRNIAVALEFGVLGESSACGRGVEGFGGRSLLAAARRVRANGGTLRYVAMDEPMFFGSLYTGANACRWTAQQVAADAVVNLKALLSEFPDVAIGDIEPVHAPGVLAWLDRYREWMDAFREAAGFPLAFFHADVLWNAGAWREALVSLRQDVTSRSIPFGVIYNGNSGDPSDLDWVRNAETHFVNYELEARSSPDHVVFQSWHAHPKQLLPETDPAAFTRLINRYFRARTALAGRVASWRVDGILSGPSGNGLASKPVELTATPVAGDGRFAVYTISGTVPESATAAVLGLRVNLECGCAGTSEFWVYEFRYSEADREVVRDFSDGLRGWGLSNPEAARIENATAPPGRALHASATAAQTLLLNSAGVAVTPGAAYSLRIAARVAPRSRGSGYFAIIFLGDRGELVRQTAPLEALERTVDRTATAGGGAYHFALPANGAAEVEYRVVFRGDEDYWPASVRTAAFTPVPPRSRISR